MVVCGRYTRMVRSSWMKPHLMLGTTPSTFCWSSWVPSSPTVVKSLTIPQAGLFSGILTAFVIEACVLTVRMLQSHYFSYGT